MITSWEKQSWSSQVGWELLGACTAPGSAAGPMQVVGPRAEAGAGTFTYLYKTLQPLPPHPRITTKWPSLTAPVLVALPLTSPGGPQEQVSNQEDATSG